MLRASGRLSDHHLSSEKMPAVNAISQVARLAEAEFSFRGNDRKSSAPVPRKYRAPAPNLQALLV